MPSQPLWWYQSVVAYGKSFGVLCPVNHYGGISLLWLMVSHLVFYAQSTIMVVSGQYDLWAAPGSLVMAWTYRYAGKLSTFSFFLFLFSFLQCGRISPERSWWHSEIYAQDPVAQLFLWCHHCGDHRASQIWCLQFFGTRWCGCFIRLHHQPRYGSRALQSRMWCHIIQYKITWVLNFSWW